MKRTLKFFLILAGLLSIIIPAVSATDYTPKSIEFDTYYDGVTEVTYSMDVDPTKVRVTVDLPGYPYHNLLILDQDGLPLDSESSETMTIIDTLGSTNLEITYLTSSLTSKIGPIWTLNVTSPISTTIQLPNSATIISMNQFPLEIGTSKEGPYLTMSSGDISVSYIIGVIDASGLADEAITDAEGHLQDIIDDRIILNEAENLMEQARSAFNAGRYADAVSYADQAQESADETRLLAIEASDKLLETATAIAIAETEERTEGLDTAKNLLTQATQSNDSGYYSNAITKATASIQAAKDATRPSTPEPQNNTTLYLGIAVLIIVGGAVGYLKFFRTQQVPGIDQVKIDLEMVFSEHNDLRMDDKEVIRFISESGGEVFANEIRERFDIPRTSLWRMIRRLIGLEILEERKVGGQSLIRVNRRYVQ